MSNQCTRCGGATYLDYCDYYEPDRVCRVCGERRLAVQGRTLPLVYQKTTGAAAGTHSSGAPGRPVTLKLAEASHTRWTADDDHYILEHTQEPARTIGARLGRSRRAVRNRRTLLRRASQEH